MSSHSAHVYDITSFWINIIGSALLYSVSAIAALVFIYLMHTNQGWDNKTLVIVLVLILVNAVCWAIWFVTPLGNIRSVLTDILAILAEMLLHWLITHTYLTASQETRQLLDADLHMDDQQKLGEVYTLRKRMAWINIAVIILIGLITLGTVFGDLSYRGDY